MILIVQYFGMGVILSVAHDIYVAYVCGWHGTRTYTGVEDHRRVWGGTTPG